MLSKARGSLVKKGRNMIRKIIRGMNKIIKLPKLIITSFFAKDRETYCIKKFYICNLDKNRKTAPYLDTTKDAEIYQYAVYEFAKEIIKKYNLKSVLDIGCGLGTKLTEIIYPVSRDITGIDVEYAIGLCKKKYSFGQWLIDDIENPRLKLNKNFDLIIAADLIEHLINPDKLLSYLVEYCHKDTLFIISTPERGLVRGKYDFGPPGNITHVREWNMREFSRYIKSRKLKILEHFLVEDKKASLNKNCQVILSKIDFSKSPS